MTHISIFLLKNVFFCVIKKEVKAQILVCIGLNINFHSQLKIDHSLKNFFESIKNFDLSKSIIFCTERQTLNF